MGPPGAWAADLMLTFGGLGSVLLLPLMLVSARRLWADQDMRGWQGQILKCLAGIILIGTGLWLLEPEPLVGLPARWGGAPGFLAAEGIGTLTAMMGPQPAYWVDWALLALAIGAGPLARGAQPRARKAALASRSPRHLAAAGPAPAEPRFPAPQGPGRRARRRAGDARDRAAPRRRDCRARPDQHPAAQCQCGHQGVRAGLGAKGPVGNNDLPSPELLSRPPAAPSSKLDKQGLERNARLLESVPRPISM